MTPPASSAPALPDWEAPAEALPTFAELAPPEDQPELPEGLEFDIEEAVRTGVSHTPGSTIRPLAEAIEAMAEEPPDPSDALAMKKYAEEAHDLVIYLRIENRLTFLALGRLAVLNEDLQLYRFAGMEHPEEFYRSGDGQKAVQWPQETVEAAVRFFRRVVPVARRAGVDLEAFGDTMGSKHISALERIATIAESGQTLITEAGRDETAETMLQVVRASDAELPAIVKSFATDHGAPARPEPVTVTANVTMRFGGGLRGGFEVDHPERLDPEAPVRWVFKLNGANVTWRQILDEYRRTAVVPERPVNRSSR